MAGRGERKKAKSSRRAGWIVQRGEDVWQVRLSVSRDGTGKRCFETRTVHGSKADAEDTLADLWKAKRKGTLETKALLVGELLDDVVRDYKINGQDVAWVQRVVNRLNPTFAKVRVSRIKLAMVEAYKAARIGKAKNQTINHELSILKRAFNLAVKKGTLSAVPFRIEKLKVSNTRKGFFEHTDYVLLRQHLPEELRPVLTMAYYSGCRKAEILGLRWSQVDLIRRIIRLEAGETKNDEGRIIPLHVEEFYQTISVQRTQRDELWPESPWVFSRHGKPIKTFQKAWDTATKAAGLWDKDRKRPTKIFHDLRRTGVRNLIRAGVPQKVCMAISGHKTPSIFERYNIIDERDVIDAMKRLDTYSRDRASQEATADEKTLAHKSAHMPVQPS